VQIETCEQLINFGAGRQFTVSKAHQSKALNRYPTILNGIANSSQFGFLIARSGQKSKRV
jgi:hypothetical protein